MANAILKDAVAGEPDRVTRTLRLQVVAMGIHRSTARINAVNGFLRDGDIGPERGYDVFDRAKALIVSFGLLKYKIGDVGVHVFIMILLVQEGPPNSWRLRRQSERHVRFTPRLTLKGALSMVSRGRGP